MYVLLVIIFIVIVLFIVIFNVCVKLRNKVRQSKSTIEVYLAQRFDLIPNLVEVVKGYAEHEKETFSKIAEMRSAYNDDIEKDLQKASELNHECNRLFAIAESMPDLKANEQFLNLQRVLERTENNLQAARRLYNGDVTLYNTTIASFPNSIVAELMGFKAEPLFEIEEYKKVNIKVDL